jgi:hypothetical protein
MDLRENRIPFNKIHSQKRFIFFQRRRLMAGQSSADRLPIQTRFPTLELFGALHGDAFSGGARSLTITEVELAKPIFKDSIDYR